MSLPRKDAMLTELDDETITDLFRYACEVNDEAAADALEGEIARRGIYGRKLPA